MQASQRVNGIRPMGFEAIKLLNPNSAAIVRQRDLLPEAVFPSPKSVRDNKELLS